MKFSSVERLQKGKAAILNRGCRLNLVESSLLWMTGSLRKRRSRYSGEPEVAKLPRKRSKSSQNLPLLK
jgi:hypothetical protein